MRRRPLLLACLLPSVGRGVAAARTDRSIDAPPLRFPEDFGAHPAQRTEWWYVTGQLESGPRRWGFQVTFFRSATGIGPPASGPGSRFLATELVFAHAAVTDLEQHRLRHDQRIARAGFGLAEAKVGETAVGVDGWQLVRTAAPAGAGFGRYDTQVASERAGFGLALRFEPTQPLLLQGDAGLSRKGPGAGDFSRYYSEPQLATTGRLTLDRRTETVTGRAWLDHEWSDAFIPAGAVGWDWIGMNLDDGSALTAFRLRRADGSSVHSGGSFRRAGGAVADFGPNRVVFEPGRRWESPASHADYPVEWRLTTPAGSFAVRAVLDAQELDSRGSTGSIYWEGLSELLDADGRRIGRGYLEMTGYASTLRM